MFNYIRLLQTACLSMCAIAALQAASYKEKVITSFDKDAEGWRASAGAKGGHSTEHGGSLQVTFTHGQQAFESTKTYDMSGWDKIKMDIYSPTVAHCVTLNAFDEAGKRYTCLHQLVNQGQNTIEYNLRGLASTIPDRGKVVALDLTKIAKIQIKLDGRGPLDGKKVFFVDNVRLTKGTEPFIRPEPLKKTGKSIEAVPGNILVNGNFELGLQYWNSWPQWDGGQYAFGAGFDKDVYDGRASAKMFCIKKGRGGIFQTVALEELGEYTIKFSVKGVDGAEKIKMGFEGKGKNKKIIGNKFKVVQVTDKWQHVEVKWNVKDKGIATLYFYHVGLGSLFLDAVSVATPSGKTGSGGAITMHEGETPSKVVIKGDRTFVNGKPFFPIGMYEVKDPVKDYKGTGFNFAIDGATGAPSKGWFKKCKEAGVMTIAGMTGMMRAHMGRTAAGLVPYVKNREAFFGYYLCDEPDHGKWNVTPAELRQATNILNEADPNHPTINLVMGWHRSRPYQYADSANVLSVDPYSLGNDMDKPVRNALWMEDAQAKKQPCWTVLQFGWDNRRPVPKKEELYGQVYASLACGVDGVLWFQRKWGYEHPKAWAILKTISLELKEIHDDLCGEEPKEIQPQFSDKRVIGITKKTDKGYLLIVVNKTIEDVGKVRITVPQLGNRALTPLFDSEKVSAENGAFLATFAPGQRHVYRIK